jgi:CBS domain-containing protein
MQVRDAMTVGVFTVGPDAPVSLVVDLMIDHQIRHVPVVNDDGELIGLVSERDVLRSASAADAGMPMSERADLLSQITATDIMTSQVETVEVDDDLASAAALMLENKFGCLPVLEEGVLTGIITEADFVRLMVERPA